MRIKVKDLAQQLLDLIEEHDAGDLEVMIGESGDEGVYYHPHLRAVMTEVEDSWWDSDVKVLPTKIADLSGEEKKPEFVVVIESVI